MAKQTAAPRTKQYLEKLGYTVGKTEQALFKFTGKGQDRRAEFLKRRDLFGFIDMIALRIPTLRDNHIPGILAVQACGATDVQPHIATIVNSPMAKIWIGAGGEIQLIAWRKVRKIKKDGTKGKSDVWMPRIINFYIDKDSSNLYSIEQVQSVPEEDTPYSLNNLQGLETDHGEAASAGSETTVNPPSCET